MFNYVNVWYFAKELGTDKNTICLRNNIFYKPVLNDPFLKFYQRAADGSIYNYLYVHVQWDVLNSSGLHDLC